MGELRQAGEVQQRSHGESRLTRRAILRVAFGAAGVAALAACGGTASTPTTSTSSAAPTPRPSSSAAPSAAPATSAAPASSAAPAASTAPSTAGTATSGQATAVRTTTAVAATRSPAAAGSLPSTGPGVPDAYVTFPTPFKSVANVPGKGGKLSVLSGSQLPPMTARDQNTYWQELDKRLGVTSDRVLVPLNEYPQKMAAVIASGDIPDLTLVRTSLAPDLNRALVQGAFTDLTPFVTGDALKEYTNLAYFPDFTYRYAQTKGKLYGIPFQNFRVGSNLLMYRRDWAQKIGVAEPKNAEDVYQLLVGMAKGDPDGNGSADTFGLAVANSGTMLVPFISAMFRVPNEWRRDTSGNLTNAIETDEYRQAIAFARRLWEGGAYHPDSGTMTSTQMQDYLIGGKTGAINAGPQDPYAVRAPRDAAKKINPAADLRLLIPPGFDGGKAAAWNNTAVNGIVGIPSKVGRDQERVKELLRIADYHAARFGSEEFRFINFGFEGVHHTIQPNGSLVRTDKGNADISELHATLFPRRVYYFPTAQITEDDLRYIQDITAQMIAIGVDNPAWTAFSATAATKAGELNQLAIDRVNGIIRGREPLTALDTYIRDWKSRGGDQIRKELEDDLRAQ